MWRGAGGGGHRGRGAVRLGEQRALTGEDTAAAPSAAGAATLGLALTATFALAFACAACVSGARMRQAAPILTVAIPVYASDTRCVPPRRPAERGGGWRGRGAASGGGGRLGWGAGAGLGSHRDVQEAAAH